VAEKIHFPLAAANNQVQDIKAVNLYSLR